MIRVLRWFRPTIAGVWYAVVIVAAIVGYALAADYPTPWRDLLAPARLATIIGAALACLALGRALARTRAPRPAILELLTAPFLIGVPALLVGGTMSMASNGYLFVPPGVDSRLHQVASVLSETEFGPVQDVGIVPASQGGSATNWSGTDYFPGERVLAALSTARVKSRAIPTISDERLAETIARIKSTGLLIGPTSLQRDCIGGYIIEATLRDGTPITVAAVHGGEVSNDRVSYHEFLFRRNADGSPGRLLSMTRFPYDADVGFADGRLWYFAVAFWLLPVPLMVSEDRARRRKRAERATAGLPSPAG